MGKNGSHPTNGDMAGLTPEQIYGSKSHEASRKLKQLHTADDRFAIARGFTFLLIAACAWLSWIEDYFSPVWVALVIVIFILQMIAHSRVAAHLKKNKQVVAYYTKRLNHIAGDWVGSGNSGDRYYDDSHPYSSDLNLFGHGSLFEYICGAPTRLGSDMLAAWLCAGANSTTIRERQDALKELTHHLDLFEKLALLEEKANIEFDQNQLQRWCLSDAAPLPKMVLSIATVMGVLSLGSLLAIPLGYGYFPFLLVLLFELGFYAVHFRMIRRVAAQAASAVSGLTILSQVMNLMEEKQFVSPALKKLNADLQCEGKPPSWQISRLNNLVLWLENSLRNQIFGPIALLTGMPFHLLARIERWRNQVGSNVSVWVMATAEMEALCSLARYSFENPRDPYPELASDDEPAVFNAKALCHPLIQNGSCVPNDILISSDRALTMVSGSNMSGKSTLLRTVGINLVLASCGAPVRAESLSTSRFQIGCAMQANDSLMRGESLFYATISRIKTVVELAGKSPPLLFLLDEILQGTNSHDRRIGAEGIIRQLVGKDAVGLITTHDLALTEIADSLGSAAVNIHFVDHLENGQMQFDFKIREGVVQKSNALELMRTIGLAVDSDGMAL